MNRLIAPLVLQLVLISTLGLISGYPMPRFEDASWETVLFLTPSGIVANHLQWSILREFYNDPSPGQIDLSGGQLAIMGILWLVLAANFTRLMRRLRRSA